MQSYALIVSVIAEDTHFDFRLSFDAQNRAQALVFAKAAGKELPAYTDRKARGEPVQLVITDAPTTLSVTPADRNRTGYLIRRGLKQEAV